MANSREVIIDAIFDGESRRPSFDRASVTFQRDRTFEQVIAEVHAIEEKARAATAKAYAEAHAMLKTQGESAAEAHYMAAQKAERAVREGPQIAKLMQEAEAIKRQEVEAKRATEMEIRRRANEKERAENERKAAERETLRKQLAKEAEARARRAAKRAAR